MQRGGSQRHLGGSETTRSQVKYTIRPCRSHAELAACVALQKTVWGYADYEVYPLRLFVTLTRIGGHVIGAFAPDGQQVGFVASIPAWHDGRRYLHSLSLGVLPGHENQGLGRKLKLAQRHAALKAGIDCVEWTFDPLKTKNAYFNIVRLGAIVRRYLPDLYGPVESRLQQGLPSDRLIAEWWLKSVRVKRALVGKAVPPPKRESLAAVRVPTDIDRIAVQCLDEARETQLAVREKLTRCFARRLAITGFTRDEKEAHYLLDKWKAG